MVEHQMIYSPERKKQWSHNEYCKSPSRFKSFIIRGNNLRTLLATVLLHLIQNGFFSVTSHIFLISAGFQPTLFTKAGRARPFFPPFLQTGFGKLWIWETARFPVGHNIVLEDHKFSHMTLSKCHVTKRKKLLEAAREVCNGTDLTKDG
jgi:hypothetical protein